MKEASELFSRVFIQQLSMFGYIQGHRRLIREGLPQYRSQALQNNTALVLAMLRDPKERRIFLEPDTLLNGGYNELATQITESAFERTESMTDASCFVFAHSVLDSGIFDFCRIMFMAAPQLLSQLVGEKKMRISDALSLDRTAILKQLESDLLDSLQFSSVINKLDMLHQNLKPDATHEGVVNYTFDRARIELIDRRRHDIVHGLKFDERLEHREDDISYMQKTLLFVVSLLNWKFGLRIDPNVR